MEKHTLRETVAEMLGESEVQRGVKLGIIGACLALVLLFGSQTLLRKLSDTVTSPEGQVSTIVNFDQGQFTGLIIIFLSGLVALLIPLILAYYSGLSSPEAKSGEAGRAGLLSGGIVMLLYWAAQTVFALVTGAGSPQGLQLDSFLRTRLIAALGFFVFGGLLGWWGCRAAARRARSILSLPGSSLISLAATKSRLPLEAAQTPPARPAGSEAPADQPASLAETQAKETEQAEQPDQETEGPVSEMADQTTKEADEALG